MSYLFQFRPLIFKNRYLILVIAKNNAYSNVFAFPIHLQVFLTIERL